MPDRLTARALVILGLLFLFLPSCTRDPVETDLLLPVDFSNVPDDMVLTAFHTDKIEIRIRGNPKHITLLHDKHITYPADLYTDLEFDPAGDSDSIETGTYLLPVDRNRIPLDPGVTILEITPSFLSVRLEKKITRAFKVSVPYAGKPAKGHLAMAPALEPSVVDLTGAQSLIQGLDTLKTKPVDLSGASETFKKEVPLDLENPLLFSPTQAMFIVTVPIQPEMGERTIEDLPIQLNNAKGRATIKPKRLSIVVKGPVDILGSKGLTDTIHAFMDLTGLSPGIHARHAYIDLPVDLVMTGASPQVFTVKIE
jgi:YbbR domain-containing protein